MISNFDWISWNTNFLRCSSNIRNQMEFILHGFSSQMNVAGLANIQNRGVNPGSCRIWSLARIGSRVDDSWQDVFLTKCNNKFSISRRKSLCRWNVFFEIKNEKGKLSSNFFTLHKRKRLKRLNLVWIYILLLFHMNIHSFENIEYTGIGILEMVSLFPTKWYARNVTALRISLTLSILR